MNNCSAAKSPFLQGLEAFWPSDSRLIQLPLSSPSVLLIATLDRLARNVHFISGLMETNVPFLAADRPTASAFEIHIFAAMAEEERRKISQRVKAALAVKRVALAREGKKLGNPHPLEALKLSRSRQAPGHQHHAGSSEADHRSASRAKKLAHYRQ